MMKFAWVMALTAGVALTGCGGLESDETDQSDESNNGVLNEELTAAQKALVGAWKGQSGAYKMLYLESNLFFTGAQIVYCIKSPCPAVAISGKWTVVSGKLQLSETKPSTITHKYNYTLSGSNLSLTDPALHGLNVGTLVKSTNPCVAAGGTCKAVYPNACGNKAHMADGTVYPCSTSGAIGTMCCLPN